MDVLREGTVGVDFLVHSAVSDLAGYDALKLRFIDPDGALAFEVEDPDVTDEGAGDFGWTESGARFPVGGTKLGIWTIIPILERSGKILPGAPSMQFKVIGQYEQS